MVLVKTIRGKWRFNQRECSNIIAILTCIEKLSNDGLTGRIRKKHIEADIKITNPDCNVSDGMLWQLGYCGFIKISKYIFKLKDFSVVYYAYNLPINSKFNLESIKSDVNSFIKYKQEEGEEDAVA